MEYAEKRDFHRMTLDSSLEYGLENDEKNYSGKVVNLSAKGVLFVAADALQVGAKVSITLTPSNDITPPMSASTLVSRCEKQSENEYQIAAEIIQIL